MSPIKISDKEKRKPLSYNPTKNDFIFFSDIIEGSVFSPELLSFEDQIKLVLKRLEMTENFEFETLGSKNKYDLVNEIKKKKEDGLNYVKAEIINLTEFIKDIENGEYI